MKPLVVSWFSAGVSSAVATKLAISEIDLILYTHIEDQHPDTLRFIKDCEKWFERPIQILQAPINTVEGAILIKATWINSPGGAPCTDYLKRRVRKAWEREHKGVPLTYIWGMDVDEKERFERLWTAMPGQQHRAPLIENGWTKTKAHQVLNASGILRPKMYDLGYHNNNCIGCVRGGKGYWNKIRREFPHVFQARAQLERKLGHSCLKNIFLDELDPEAGRNDPPIMQDCGIMCEIMSLSRRSEE